VLTIDLIDLDAAIVDVAVQSLQFLLLHSGSLALCEGSM
jgi:hypothetical protein